MTVADNLFPHRGGRARGGAGSGNPWRRLWQVPLLLAGVTVFGLGLRAFVKTIRPVPFEKQVAAVQSQIDAGQFNQALQEINSLAPYYTQPGQQSQLEALAGDAVYFAQERQPSFIRDNYAQAARHYERAAAWGLVATPTLNERWGATALALGDARTAIEKLEAALTGSHDDPVLVMRHTRELVSAYMDAGEYQQAFTIVERLLAALEKQPEDDLSAMEDRTWSLCKRIEIALAAEANAHVAASHPAGPSHEAGETAGEAPEASAGTASAAGESHSVPAEGNMSVARAVGEGRKALANLRERDPKGRVLVWIARAELEHNDVAGAKRDLEEARKCFVVHHLDDGRAAVMLARIALAKGDIATAGALFAEVVERQASTSIWPAARMGRAEILVRRGSFESAQVLEDYRFVIQAVKDRDDAPVGKKPEMIGLEPIRASLLDSYQRARDRGSYDAALQFLALEQQADNEQTPALVLRFASTTELRGEALLAAQHPAEARQAFGEAADAYLKHAKIMTLSDEQSGNSLWKAGDLYDRSGATLQAAAVYDQFTIQRPRDSRVPEGLLALGQLYESAGMIDKALAAYERNVHENGTTPAAYSSQVHMAHCYARLAERASKPEDAQALRQKAEALLLALVQDNTNLLPAAREFRQSLLALGELYYQQGRWSEAILRLDEMVTRYPDDPEQARTRFMLAESYRKSAAEIAAAIEQDPGIARRSELERARAERLLTAAGEFTRVIGLLDAEASGNTGRKLSALDQQYVLSSYMDRAECYFLRGDYEQAIKRYDEAAARFSDDLAAVEAYVQIVNGYVALKQPAQAASAAERGRWLLKRVPESAFESAPAGREHYEKLLAMGKMP